MRHCRAAASLSLFVVLVLGGCAAGGGRSAGSFDWPCWRGPDGNGISRETDWDPHALAGGPRVVWKADIGSGYSGIAIRAGRLYALGFRDEMSVTCLDAWRGGEIWRAGFEGIRIPQATPAVDSKSVYTLDGTGLLACLDARTGRLRWKKDLVKDCGAVKPYYGFAGSPMLEGNLVLLNANTSGMALEKATGKLVWASEAPPAGELVERMGDDNGATYMTPVLCTFSGMRCMLVYGWKGLSAIQVKDGKVLWTYQWRTYDLAKTPDPVIVGDRILIADENLSSYRHRQSTLIRIVDGRPGVVWESPELVSDLGTPIVIGGYIFDSHGGPYSCSWIPTLRCLELDTGRLAWEHARPLAFDAWLSLAAAGDKLITLTGQGVLSVVEASPRGYEELSSCEVPAGKKGRGKFCTPPVLCNGLVYCRSADGTLVCIDVRRETR